MLAPVEKVRGTFLATSIDLHSDKEVPRVSFPQAPLGVYRYSQHSRPRWFALPGQEVKPMHSVRRFHSPIFGASLRPQSATVAILLMLLFFLLVLLLVLLTPQPAQAQTYQVLHNFTGGADGAVPEAGLTMDQAGNLYGTANTNGAGGWGTVFKLSHKGSAWVFNPLYSFAGGNDGAGPFDRVIFGPDGSLYGTTYYGLGNGCAEGHGCGTVFDLKPYLTTCRTALCGWQETVLYSFTGGGDGAHPFLGDLIFDRAGNLYGTTLYGGAYGQGEVFELAASNGGWTESVLYSFTGGSDGAVPYTGLIFDNVGNLYGTTSFGGDLGCDVYNEGCGTVFQLTPSGSGWTENVLYSFQNRNEGGYPWGGLIFDQAGNLYGTTVLGGTGNGGTAFELTPSKGAVPWAFELVYGFSGDGNYGSVGGLAMDPSGNLYGTTLEDGAYGAGSVFKLTPSSGGWTYTSLHDFTGGSDGMGPVSNVTFDVEGNLYGTAELGGAYGNGVVWEITP